MIRRTLIACLGVIAGCLLFVAPATAQPSLTLNTVVTNSQSGPCTNGSETWTVTENITINNDSTSVDTITSLTGQGKYDGTNVISPITVVSDGGMVGASIPAGQSQTFTVVFQFSTPCGISVGSVGPVINILNGHKVFSQYADFVSGSTSVPVATYAGFGAFVLLAGGGLLFLQRRSKTETASV